LKVETNFITRYIYTVCSIMESQTSCTCESSNNVCRVNFQYHGQFVDTDNITWWDQRKKCPIILGLLSLVQLEFAENPISIFKILIWGLKLPISTNVVSLNTAHAYGKLYSIQHYVINLSVTCDRVVVFSGCSVFLHQ
jgi:hypothetical protein